MSSNYQPDPKMPKTLVSKETFAQAPLKIKLSLNYALDEVKLKDIIPDQAIPKQKQNRDH